MKSCVRTTRGVVAVALVLVTGGVARSQTPSTNAAAAPDPLMTLMLSQPRIDVQSPVKPIVSFEPRVISPGGQATYRVVLNALEAAVAWPDRLPEIPGLELRAGGRGQVLQPSAVGLEPRTTILYRAIPKAAGRYTVPGFETKVYGRTVAIPATTLEVVNLPPTSASQPQLLYLEFPTTNLFVGQAVRARLSLPSDTNGFSQSLAYVRFIGDGFVADQSSVRQRIEGLPNPSGGPSVSTYIYEAFVTPIASGEISIFAQGYTASSRFSGPIVISGGTVTLAGGPPQFSLLDSDPLTLQVRPLPKTGVLPGFKGAVGSFTVDPPRLSTNMVQVGQPLKLTAIVRGTGNLARLVPPEPPRHKQWQVFAAPLEPVPPQVQHLQGFASFNFTLIPLSDEATVTPAIPFAYFDPGTESYVELTIPSVPVTVRPGGPAGPSPLPDDATIPEDEVETLQLADLAGATGRIAASLTPVQERPWFPWLQLLPGVAFLGLVAWDRRRRYFEQHPEVLVRRRARRAMRRHWGELEKFAAAGDAFRFAESAVRAMRSGCAPFFPAEPRALVGADVLSLFPERVRTGSAGQAVRRIFDLVDARQFGGLVGDQETLLAARSDIERVLAFLEERLRP